MTKLRWVLGGIVTAAVLVVGGTWVYINVLREDAPPPLTLADADTAGPDTEATSTTSRPEVVDVDPEGTWVTTGESIAGYRVGEILFGQSTEAVGRTDQVDGEITVEGTTVTAGSFEVDMASVESDESRRDGQFRGRIMDVETHPTATLVLASPIELGEVPAEGETITATAPAELTLRGTTLPVEVEVEARLAGGRIEIAGSIPIVFADWGIPNPSAPGIDTEDEGLLEVLLVLERA